MKKNLDRFHGDILFIETKLPKGAKLVEKTTRFVAAEGETTGHKHVVSTVDEAVPFKVMEINGNRYFVLTQAATVTHEEHAPLTLWPGVYIQRQEREYDWFQNIERKVVD